jgi:hypothetical protein
MYQDDLARAQSGNSPAVLLHEMTGAARSRVVEALAAAVVREAALELADYLAGEHLAKAKAAAAEPVKAHEAATKARAHEEQSVAGRIATYFAGIANRKAGAAASAEHDPERETAKVRELRAAKAAAAAEAFPFTQAVATVELQVSGLRNAPTPDPAVLAVLAESLCGCHVDAPKVNSATMDTGQAPQAGALVGGSRDAD